MSPRPDTESVFPTLAELIALRAPARALELGARRLALSAQAGGYRSVYRGRGLEFDEVRGYQPGDEVRAIDWRVTARRGRPHTRLYREERERPVLLCADLGAGMLFGSRRLKSAQALRAAALLAWAAEQAGNRVGGVVAGTAGHAAQPPMPRREAVLALLKTLVELQPRVPAPPDGTGLLDAGLARLARAAHPGSLVPVLSDFQQLGAAGERALNRLARHNDLVLIQVFDPLEAEPPPAGRYRLGVPGHLVELDSAASADAWRTRFHTQRQRLERLARRLGCPLLALDTDAHPLTVLARGLQRHGRAA